MIRSQTILENFKKSQQEKGVPDNEIDQALFIATNVVAAQTAKELQFKVSEEKIKELKEKFADRTNFLNQDVVNSAMNLPINSDDKTYWDIFNKNLQDFLNQL